MNNQNKALNLAKAIEELEDFLYCENEGKLYRFLLNIIEKPVIENTLRKTGGNQLKAAKILGINRNTLHTKINKLNIPLGNFKCPKNFRNFRVGKEV